MSTRSPEIITRASEVDSDLVPEPWDPRDNASDRSLVAERERYRLDGVTGAGGAGIVPAYALDVSGTEAIPQNTQDGWVRGSAARVLNAQGQYVSRGSDVPRLSFDGDEAGLLVEATQRTNVVLDSSDPSTWNSVNVSLSPATSILDGEISQEVTSSTASAADRIEQFEAGSFSGGTETLSFYIEKGSAPESRVEIVDTTGGVGVAGITIDWSSETLVDSKGNADDHNLRVLFASGPNGSKVAVITTRYSNQTQGNSRKVLLKPDPTSNGGSTYLHHAQLEEASNATSPIVTSGSATTRAADDYAIFEGAQPPWWNSSEMTLILETEPRYFSRGTITGFRPILRSNTSGEFVGTHKPENQPFSLQLVDPNEDNPTLAESYNAFQKNKIGLSLGPDANVLSVNGSSVVESSSGILTLNTTTLTLGDEFGTLYHNVLAIPRALSESTLNRITS